MPALDDLKTQVLSIARLIPKNAPVVYIDIPVYMNIGDLLINAGTEEFFRVSGINVTNRYALSDFPLKPGYFSKDTVLIFQGGGNFGDIWKPHQEYRERIIGLYPRNRCIVFPQTVHFQSDEAFSRSMTALARHPDLHILARDRRSFEILQRGNLQNVQACPDMAHTLLGKLGSVTPGVHRTLVFLRVDREASQERETGIGQSQSIDWRDITPLSARVTRVLMSRLVKSSRYLGTSAPYLSFWYPIRDRLIRRAAECFRQYDKLVTDRLHGMLLGLLVGMEVTAIDNSYGKLSGYAESWLADRETLHFQQMHSNR